VREKASVALLFVTLGVFGLVSAAWAKKDKVEVTLTAPAAGALYNAPAAIVLSAIAQAKQKSHPIVKVEFFQGTNFIGAVAGPRRGDQYTVNWTGVAAGNYAVTAKATNDKGDTDLSKPVLITVNALPIVSLTSPSSNASFKAPANIPLAVQVADTDGSIVRVEFFYGGTLITALRASPYSFVWSEVPQGAYALTARVTDNLGGIVTSVLVNVTVNAAEAKLYYIHVDHLNTPRLIADDQQRTLWRWDQQEPFGVNVPDENPSSLGAFEFPVRFAGQYYDRETAIIQNRNRDYDSALGRYVQSDPIGLSGGLNTYAYVGGNPISFADPSGLETYQCRRPLGGLPGDNQRSGPDIWGNPLYHQYSCTRNAKGKLVCGGQGFSESWWSSPGKATTSATDYYSADACKQTQGDNKCFEQCLIDEWKKPRPHYGIPFGTDCQEYDEDVNLGCRKKCGLK
jgi:RHS repeat-associated protein